MLVEHTKFYYYALSEDEQQIFMQIYKGIEERRKTIHIHTKDPKITGERLYDIAKAVYNDTPSFYYFDAKQIRWQKTANGCDLIVTYMYSDDEIEQYDKKIMEIIDHFKRQYIRPGMSDYEKELAIHDYLVRTVKYDHAAIEAKNNKQEHIDEAYNVLGAILKKCAVCWGIACAFKLLCNACDLKSIVVIGGTDSERDRSHAWNIVKIDEIPYHVDVTWDIKDKGDISFCYDYFNLDDDLLDFNHKWDREFFPPCNAHTHNYYYKHKLYVSKLSAIQPFLKQHLSSGKRYVAFKYASYDMPSKEEILAEIHEVISSTEVPLPWPRSYTYAINETTHNIYIEIKT